MPRPKKAIDEQQVHKLAAIGCSGKEIAAVLGCCRDTLYKRFPTAIKEGHERMKSSLRRAQYKKAMEGNPAILIWLGKQYLGQRDKQELAGSEGGPVQVIIKSSIPRPVRA